MEGDPGDRVLLIQLKRIGDVLLCTPLVRALATDRAGRRILFLTETPNLEVLRGNPAIEEALTIPDPMKVADWIRIRGRLRAFRPSSVIDCSGTPRSCLLSWISGAPVRVGFRVRLPRRLIYNRVVVPDRSKYTVDRRLDLVRALRVEGHGFRPEMFLDETDRSEADRLLRAAGFAPEAPLMAIAPTSRKQAKRWAPDRFARAAAWARAEMGLEPLLLCGYGEEEQEEEVRRQIPGGARRLPGVPPVRVLAALIERSRCLLANDGGPKHLAVALGVPTVTVFVSTASFSWHPPNDPRHVAIEATDPGMGDVSRVQEAITSIESSSRAGAILFLCVANSARSQMAEAIARSLAPPGLEIYSAGSEPGRVHPLAVVVLSEIGIDISGQWSKGVDAIPFDRIRRVVTLCAEEVCPTFPRSVTTLHWPLADPAAERGDEAARLAAFRSVRDELRAGIAGVFETG